MKVYETLNTTEKILKFKNTSCVDFIGRQDCPRGNCTKCKPIIEYLNSEVPKNALEEIGAKLVENYAGMEKWEMETETETEYDGIIYITISLENKTFDVIGNGTVETAKAIIAYLETL